MFAMPGLQTASAREETGIWNQAGARYWAAGSNCRETKWFKRFLIGGKVTNPINELDLISEIEKQGKEKKWINPKRKGTPLLQEPIWWIRSSLSAASSQKGLYDFTFFAFTSYSSSHRAGMTKPNIPYQLTPGVISSIRENIPLFPSTTSWHQWLLQAFLPKWGSLQNGFAFLQKYRTGSTVHFQWNSVVLWPPVLSGQFSFCHLSSI